MGGDSHSIGVSSCHGIYLYSRVINTKASHGICHGICHGIAVFNAILTRKSTGKRDKKGAKRR